MRLPPSLTVLVAFVAGISAGIALQNAPAIAAVMEPIGTLWINAIRMPIIPLVVALVVSGVAGSGDTGAVGRLTLRALTVFVVILSAYAVVVTLISPALMSGLQLDPESTARLRESASIDTQTVQGLTFAGWLVSLVPANPIRSAVDGALLPLVIFSLAWGLAVTRLSEEVRTTHVRFFRGVADALIAVIGWVVRLAPIGVFALSFSLGARLGGAAVGAVAYYLIVDVLLLVACIIALYVATILVARVPLRDFAAAAFPAQLIAFTTRSSLAALPVLITSARERLRLSDRVVSVVLPLAASVFKPNSPITWPLGAWLVATLYGVELSATQWAIFGVGSVLLSFTTPGIPSGGFFVQAPLYAAVGLPPEGIGLLIAVDFIPDLFKTVLNITSYLSAALVAAKQGIGTRE